MKECCDPHYVGECKCACGHTFIGVVHADANLDQLECLKCGSHNASLSSECALKILLCAFIDLQQEQP